jgi:hypothetical protein
MVQLDVFPLPDWVIVTSPFGMRWGRMHRGVDFGSPDPSRLPIYGAPIRAPFAGKVTTGYEPQGAGWWAWVDAKDGRGLFKSFHHSHTAIAHGDVNAGDIIAYVGSTGASTGPHAHLELWVNGAVIDPLPSLLAAKNPPQEEDSMPSQDYFEVKFAELHQHISKERETMLAELEEHVERVLISGLRGNVLTAKEIQDQLLPLAAKLGVDLPPLNVND